MPINKKQVLFLCTGNSCRRQMAKGLTRPFFPGKTKTMHKGFDDPSGLARNAATEEKALGYYRRVRDEIKSFIMKCDEL